jgi:hypothetical protein
MIANVSYDRTLTLYSRRKTWTGGEEEGEKEGGREERDGGSEGYCV